MTTIATDGKSMAGDGQSCISGTILCSGRVKVMRTADGSIVGCSGDSVHCDAFRKWINEGGPKPKIKDFMALVLRPTGEVLYYNEACDPTSPDVPCAVGSGMDFAIGALEAGMSPERAIEIAAKRDVHTGGTITVLHLEAAK